MKKSALLLLIFFVSITTSQAQISITASDVPVSGDTLRFSDADPTSTIDLNTTGANVNWDFSSLAPISQTIDSYKSALSVSPLLAFSYASAYGIRTDISGLTGGISLPIPVTDIYFFYQKRTSPGRYVGRGYGATLSGTTLPLAYSDEDEMYYLPLAFSHHDSSSFALAQSIPNLADIKIVGTRITDVDGWGTIITPYFTTPINCIRLRSVIDEIDSITYNGTAFGIPRTTVEYKWLTTGNHYPALFVTANSLLGNEVVSSIRYKDQYRQLTGIANVHGNITKLNVYPNPTDNGRTTIEIPENWRQFVVSIYDVAGKMLQLQLNTNHLDVSAFAKGTYFVRVISGNQMGLAFIEK